ncbi:hypothetical protein [Emticicia sp. 17c]
MLADAPQYHYDTDTRPSGKARNLKHAQKLTNQNAQEMLSYFEGLNGK